MSSDQPQAPTPATPPPANHSQPVQVAVPPWLKYIGDKYGPLGVVLGIVLPTVYPVAERVLNTHITFVQKTDERDAEKTKMLGQVAEAMKGLSESDEKQTELIGKQADLIREIKDENRDMRFDIREIHRTLGAGKPGPEVKGTAND